MRTINLQTVYQLVITALLLGACLGLLGQHLPWLAGSPIAAMEQGEQLQATPNAGPKLAATAPQNQDVMTNKNPDINVRVEVEGHARGNAQAHAHGPQDTQVKADTAGEGDGHSVTYITASEALVWTEPVQLSLLATTAPTGNRSLLPVPASSAYPIATVVAAPVVATVIEAIVNLRSAPDLGSTVIGTAARGQQFTVVGRDGSQRWWLVCCHQEQPYWVYSAIVQVVGDVANIQALVPSGSANAATTKAPTPTPTVPPQYEFKLVEQAQFEERITPRIFLYVHEGEEGLDGYTLRVHKDGNNLFVTKTSAAGLPGYSWPTPTERQRYTNLKVEFPTVSPAGLWEVQLVDAEGRAVGPIATFRLQPNEANQEMYLNYQKR